MSVNEVRSADRITQDMNRDDSFTVTSAALIAIVLLPPLAIAPDVFLFSDVTPKIVALLFGVVVAILAVDRKELVHLAQAKAWGRVFVLALVAQVFSIVISTVCSHDLGLSLAGTNWRRYGAVTELAIVIFALVATGELVSRQVTLRALLRATSLAGAGAGLYAVFEIATTDYFSLPSWASIRAASTFGHPVYFANFLASMVFVAVAQSRSEKNRVWRGVGAGAALLALVGIVLSGTRSAVLGVVVAGLFLLPESHLGRRAWQAASALCVLVVALFCAPWWGLSLRNRLGEWLGDYRGGTHLFLWRDCLRMFKAAWLVGFGPETFPAFFPRFQSEGFAKAYPNAYSESPHNIFIDAALSQGLPGLVIMMLLVGLGFYGCHVLRKSDQFLADCLRAALIASLIVHQFACFTAVTAVYLERDS